VKRASRRVRTPLTTALALAGLLPVLAGCAVFSPTGTGTNYNPSNGVNATVGSVLARDLVVIGQKGSAGLVSGALVNNGDQPQTVTITVKGSTAPVKVDVPAGSLVTLGAADSGAQVGSGVLGAGDGALLAVTVSTPSGGAVTANVPVLPPVREYATVTPAAS
jgi:hypothetical protein